MDRKQILKEIEKLAKAQHRMLGLLAEAQVAADPTALAEQVKATAEKYLPGASAMINGIAFGELESAKPYLFLKYVASNKSNELKNAVLQAAKEVLKKDINLQAVGTF